MKGLEETLPGAHTEPKGYNASSHQVSPEKFTIYRALSRVLKNILP